MKNDRKERVERFGVSVEEGLVAKFDAYIKKKGYINRSEAIRDMIREILLVREIEQGGEMMGIIVIVFDHHQPKLVEKLLELQHDSQAKIVASQHVHLDHHHCLETIIVRGDAARIETLQGKIGSLKGVGQCLLSRTSCRVMH